MTEPVSAREVIQAGPAAPSEEAATQPLCPCGSREHAPERIGQTFSTSGPEQGLYACPETPTRYGLGGAA